jgi:hypothetical protein
MELFKLLGTIAIDNSQANKDIDETTGKASDSSGKMEGAFKKVGAAVATFFAVDKIKDFGVGCINAAADASAAASQFSQVFGDLESKASSSLSGIADKAGITESRMKGSFTKIAAFAKTTGMDTESALNLSERAMIAVADSAAFYDRSLEETTESLQSFLKGNFENDAALGLSCTETTRNAAANKLYGKSFKDLSEEQKQLTLLQMVEDANKASGALGQAARESDTWTNVTGNLKQSWTDFQAVIGSHILPTAVNVVKSLAGKVEQLAEKVPDIVAWFEKYKGVLVAVGTAIGVVTAGVTAYNVVQTVKAAMAAAEVTTVWGLVSAYAAQAVAMAAVLAPYIAIAAAIAAVIAIGVTLVKNWDEIKAKVGELAGKAKEKFDEMKQAASEKFEAMKQAASEKFESMKQAASEKFESIKETMGTIMQAAKDTVSEKLSNMKNAYDEHGGGIQGIAAAAIEGVKGYYSAGFTFIDNLTGGKLSEVANKVKTKMSEAKNAVSEKISSIKSAFSSGFSNALSTVTSKFESIKTKVSSVMNSARDIVKGAIDKIKGFFNFNWSLPKLKMPHPKISGKFSLNPPSVPKFSIEWYKKAYDNPMILNEPSIFGYSPASGKLLGGGDGNGGEVVSGADTLMNMIQTAVATQNEALVYYLQKIIQMLADFFPKVLEALMNMNVVLDDGTLVGRLAPAMDLELGKIKGRKDRGR